MGVLNEKRYKTYLKIYLVLKLYENYQLYYCFIISK